MTTYNSSGLSATVSTLISTRWYYYNASGNVTRVVTSPEGSDTYEPTRFGYARNGSTVSFVLGESWTNDGSGIANHTVHYAREFRYDAARERYLNRELNPAALKETGDLVAIEDTWTDYDDNQAYGDFLVDSGTGDVAETRSYDPGVAMFGWQDDGSGTAVPESSTVAYYHTDLISTTRHLTDVNNAQINPAVYTAFGERIDGTNHRYGYGGKWGYQAHSDFPYVHVGHRYYDPSSGRFLQRDPIGIKGGVNVYAYVRNGPTIRIDPDGLDYNPPGPTGGRDTGFTDGFWTKWHYTMGWIAGKLGLGYWPTICFAIKWEIWESKQPWGEESDLNRVGDVYSAAQGYIDAGL